MNGAAIAARGLAKRFGPAVALAGLDLDLSPGQVLAVLGPNGAGKSTLLRLLAGLARPSGGSLTLDGGRAHGRQARARVGYVGHATLLYPALTARENLVFTARMYGVRDPGSRAAVLLDEQGLAHVADRPVAGFSRGMAQRVAIARGLVHDPGVVLLDEPFTGLDRRAAERLLERLLALRGAGRTLVLATHDLAAAARLADRALVLARGQVVHRCEGPTPAAELEAAYLEAVETAP
ncbi:MAG: heme ABC exporter ATP-binding protein CcmA [Myxococcota bacterium]|nr:heme ABC exporter ATP-binding protein CcmA [Myxococcota bacterium]